MAPLDRPLDVLRVDVPAADDDQVLDPARDEQLAVAEEPEVAGAEERAAVVPGQAGAADVAGLLGAVPVALRDARPRDPDLAHAVVGARAAGAGVDDRDDLALGGAAAADQPRGGRASSASATSPRPSASASTDSTVGRAARRIARDEQGGLGQPVAGQERLAPEAAGGERLGEAVERLGADRLGAVEGDPPAAQVEPARCSGVVFSTQRS